MKLNFNRLLFLAPMILFSWQTVQAWEPTKPIEFVIPAGTGGGADQMARLISGIAEKNKLSPRAAPGPRDFSTSRRKKAIRM